MKKKTVCKQSLTIFRKNRLAHGFRKTVRKCSLLLSFERDPVKAARWHIRSGCRGFGPQIAGRAFSTPI